MVALAQPIAKIALTFSTPEYFAIIFFGLVSVGSLGGGSLTNAFISLFFGLLISTVGVDDIYGAERFVFGVPLFKDGIDYLVVMVGAYGLGEVFSRMEKGFVSVSVEGVSEVKTRLPSLREALAAKMTFLRGIVRRHRRRASCPAPARRSRRSSPTAPNGSTAGGRTSWARAFRRASSRRRPRPPRRWAGR